MPRSPFVPFPSLIFLGLFFDHCGRKNGKGGNRRGLFSLFIAKDALFPGS
jgi:hypothetical protein